MVESAEQGRVGFFNMPASRGHSTMAQLLNLCKTVTNSDANFTWVPSDFILKHKIEPWTELPIWISPEMYGFFGFDMR